MKATQCEKILRHLKDFGSITSQEATQEYGIMRLASRINDLRAQGVAIVSETAAGKWRGHCFECGHSGAGAVVRHEAQVMWNYDTREVSS